MEIKAAEVWLKKIIKSFGWLIASAFVFIIYLVLKLFGETLVDYYSLIFAIMFLAVHFMKSSEKTTRIFGKGTLFLSFVMVLIPVNQILAVLFFFIFASWALLWLKKELNLKGIFLILFAAFELIVLGGAFLLISEFLNGLFSKNVDVINLSLLFGNIIFGVWVTFYLCKEVCYLLNKKGIIGYADYTYLCVALALIVWIFLAGFWGAQNFYAYDYPFDIPAEASNFSGSISGCVDVAGRADFVDGARISCKVSFSEEGTLDRERTKVFVLPRRDVWRELNKSQYDFFPETDQLNEIERFELNLDKNNNAYQLDLEYAKNNESSIQRFFFLKYETILSEEEYSYMAKRRAEFIVAVLTLGLFSAFSVVANLKEILEGNPRKAESGKV